MIKLCEMVSYSRFCFLRPSRCYAIVLILVLFVLALLYTAHHLWPSERPVAYVVYAGSLNKPTAELNIFFISYKQHLTRARPDKLDGLLLYCSVESVVRAARYTPYIVHVYTNDVDNILQNFQYLTPDLTTHIRVIDINVTRVFESTPLAAWFSNKGNLLSRYEGVKVSDAARLALIYKHGGLYLDSDIIVVSPDFLRLPSPSLAREYIMEERLVGQLDKRHLPRHPHQPDTVTNSLLHFPRKHPFIWQAMEGFVSGYEATNRTANGPPLLTSLLRRCNAKPKPDFCGDDHITSLSLETINTVNGAVAVAVFTSDYRRLPYVWPDEVVVPGETVGVHWSHFAVESSIACLPPHSILQALADTHCPLTTSHFRQQYLCPEKT